MTTIGKIRTMQTRITEQRDHITTEQGTRNALVNPFIRDILGYDPENITHVKPEILTGKQVGITSDERADYALMVDGTARVIIEAKRVGTSITDKFVGQLSKYVTAVQSVKYGIFTDGVTYTFFGQFQFKNLMDIVPFASFRMDEDVEEYLDLLQAFSRDTYNEAEIRQCAKEIAQRVPLRDLIRAQLQEPDQELLDFISDKVRRPVSKETFVSAWDGTVVPVVTRTTTTQGERVKKSWYNPKGETGKLQDIFMACATDAEIQEYKALGPGSKSWSMSVKVAERSGWERK